MAHSIDESDFYERSASIIKQSLIAGALGFTLGTSYQVIRIKPNAIRAGLIMGANWTVFGAFFFGLRNNILAQQSRRNMELGFSKGFTRDSDSLFASTASGVLTGGLLSGLNYGPNKIVAGMFYFGLGGSVGQLAYTYFYRLRQKKILATTGANTPEEVKLTDYSVNGVLDALVDSLPSWIPIRKVSDEEYLGKLGDKLLEMQIQLEEVLLDLKVTDEKLIKAISLRPRD